MSAITHELRASYAFMERNFFLVKRYWTWELVWLAYSTANCLSIGYIGVGMEQFGGTSVDDQFLVLYLVVGALVWRYLVLIFYWITDIIGLERWEGTIEYTLMAPIHRLTHMAGQTVFSIIYALISTGLVLLMATIAFRLDLRQANLPGAVLVLLAGSLSFIGIGIVGSVLPLLFPERGAQMTHVIVAVLLLVSGVYYPVEVLPQALQALAALSPATYILEGVRAALLENAGLPVLMTSIVPTVAIGLVLIPIGLQVFAAAERYAKRAGKLHRNG
ncbi:MAG TPA: ABC transporter permease [Anaerolineales bacterium]|nr:ABC transporter permease [Anaerolineales bacterium]